MISLWDDWLLRSVEDAENLRGGEADDVVDLGA